MLLLWDDDVKAKKTNSELGQGLGMRGVSVRSFFGLDAQVTEEGYSDLSLPGA